MHVAVVSLLMIFHTAITKIQTMQHHHQQSSPKGFNEFIEKYGVLPDYENYYPYTRNMLSRLGNSDGASEFMKQQYDTKAHVYWDRFYTSNKNNFFKDRHWITREFLELNAMNNNMKNRYCFMEAGCGVGNTFYPLLENNFPEMKVYAFDFSKKAVDIVKQHDFYLTRQMYPDQITAFVHDLTAEPHDRIEEVPDGSVDFATLVFVLSAITPTKFETCVTKIYNALKPGGVLFVRDYARDDLAQTRFSNKEGFKKLSDQFYVRGDGTRAYYFDVEEMTNLFTASGRFEVIQCEVCVKKVINVKEQKNMDRRFVQARFRKL
jgi:methyltransferase-like protein 6